MGPGALQQGQEGSRGGETGPTVGSAVARCLDV